MFPLYDLFMFVWGEGGGPSTRSIFSWHPMYIYYICKRCNTLYLYSSYILLVYCILKNVHIFCVQVIFSNEPAYFPKLKAKINQPGPGGMHLIIDDLI